MIFRISIWVLFLVGGSFAGFYFDSLFFKTFRSNILFHFISFITGVAVLALVLLISKNTGRTLAKYGRKGDVARMDTNVFVNKGVYKYMRHPMHLGLMLFPVAVSLLLGSVSFFLFIAPVEIIIIYIMILLIEEPEALKKFGDEYKEYSKDTPRFCLKIKCVRELLSYNSPF